MAFENSRRIEEETLFKLLRAIGGCLGIDRRRRTRIPAISLGELDRSFDPGISEWSNPMRVMSHYTLLK
jgi:hypothetical protein